MSLEDPVDPTGNECTVGESVRFGKTLKARGVRIHATSVVAAYSVLMERGRSERCGVGRQALTRTARTVEGHHRSPPWAVGTCSALRSAAIWRRLLPEDRSWWMRFATSAGTAGFRP